jgi:PAS domain S-box-containing protein
MRLLLYVVLASFVWFVIVMERSAAESSRHARDELQRNNEALRERERELAETRRLAHIGHWEHDLVTDRLTFSEETGRIIGRTGGGGFCQADLQAVIHPDDRHLESQALADALRGGQSYDVEYRIIRPDGEVRFVHVWDKIIRDKSGRPLRIFGTVQDVTERRRAEEQLRRAEGQARRILDTIPQQIWSGPADGTLDYCNEQWRAYTGLSLEEIQGQGWQRMLHPDDKEGVLNAWRESVANGTPYEKEERHRRADEVYRWFLSRGIPLRGAGGRVERWYGTNTDIEDRKCAEQALRDSAGRLQQLSRRLLRVQEEERRHLARELHDEVGQLLTGLLLLLPDGDLPRDAAKARLAEARGVIDGLLERVRTLSFDLRPAALDQLGLVPALLTLFERCAHQTGVVVDFKHQGVERRFQPEVETAAYRVVQEALTNAARHAGVTAATVRAWATADLLGVQVEDRGRGFDPEAAPRSGGLDGMRERVALLGGELSIESRPADGTQITAEFPLRQQGEG